MNKSESIINTCKGWHRNESKNEVKCLKAALAEKNFLRMGNKCIFNNAYFL